MGREDTEKLISELTAIVKEFGKPARIVCSSRKGDITDDAEFIKELLELLSSEDDDEAAEDNEGCKLEDFITKEEKPTPVKEEKVVEDDFETFVGGLVVDAVEVEDDGERMYFCSIDDDAFYMPKPVFEKYFVKI